MFNLHEIYDLAVQIEKNGEEFFREAENKVSNPPLKAIFLWLAEQEVRHSNWFMQRKASLKEGAEAQALDEMSSKMLQDILGDQLFSLGDVVIEHIDTAEGLLSMAMEFEEDTIIFFGMFKSLIEDDKIIKGIDEIIEEEKRHIQMLQDYRETGEPGLTGIKGKPDGGKN
jgi:rubrerythrin